MPAAAERKIDFSASCRLPFDRCGSTEKYFLCVMSFFDCHPSERTAKVVLYFLLVLGLFDTIAFAARRRDRDVRLPRRNRAPLENGNEALYDEMKSIRQIFEDESARKDLVDVLDGGQYFQDIFVEHPERLKIQFGHVFESPREWEQRFEQKDLKDNEHRGKIRWGNDNGEYGEHYWDFNHG